MYYPFLRCTRAVSWWCHQMETFSALLALCEGNPPVTGGFPSQRPVARSVDVFFICAWTNGWVNNRDAGDLRRHRAHYDVLVTKAIYSERGSNEHDFNMLKAKMYSHLNLKSWICFSAYVRFYEVVKKYPCRCLFPEHCLRRKEVYFNDVSHISFCGVISIR